LRKACLLPCLPIAHSGGWVTDADLRTDTFVRNLVGRGRDHGLAAAQVSQPAQQDVTAPAAADLVKAADDQQWAPPSVGQRDAQQYLVEIAELGQMPNLAVKAVARKPICTSRQPRGHRHGGRLGTTGRSNAAVQ
jgi:hypothetical protein